MDLLDKLDLAIETNRRMRDDNFMTPGAILVFTEATGALEEVAIINLPLRFLLSGKGARWCYADLGEITAAKALLYRQSVVAHEISEEDPTAEPPCGTVVLVQHADQHCLSWYRITAQIAPELNAA